jgi:hypothetical protein
VTVEALRFAFETAMGSLKYRVPLSNIDLIYIILYIYIYICLICIYV